MLQALGTWLAAIDLTVLIAAFLAFALLEVWRPHREHRVGLALRWTTNLGLFAINTLAAGLLLPLAAVTLTTWAWTPTWHPAADAVDTLGPLPVLLVTMLALDLSSYAMHRVEHAALPLWRLHAVHHADTHLDASTGVRHHPLEYLLAAGIGAAVITLLGLPTWAVSIYAAIALAAAVTQHANLVLPARLDAWLRPIFVTPAIHEVHHSVDTRDHGSNYGTLFSFWDRLFGTYSPAPASGADDIRFGVEPFTAATYAAPHWGLLLPLRIQAAGTVTPIMSPARTSPASRASSHPSVPFGRIGSTIQR